MDTSQLIALLAVVAVSSCSRDAPSPERRSMQAATAPKAPTAKVARGALPQGASDHGGAYTYNSLPALFAGQVGSHLLLSELSPDAPWVGVGSLTGLRGEIAIFDGEIWVSYPTESVARRTRREQAAFLVVARIDAWKEVTLEREVSWQLLPDELAHRARGLGFSGNDPLAIRIDGLVENLEFNIVNGPALGIERDAPGPLPKEKLSQTAAKRSFARERAQITGFYAPDNGQAFIHPGKKMHLHVILPELEQMGHLDAVTLPKGLALKLGRPVSE